MAKAPQKGGDEAKNTAPAEAEEGTLPLFGSSALGAHQVVSQKSAQAIEMRPLPDSDELAPFHMLSTCSWEQSDEALRLYVPLRGVHSELVRASFRSSWVEVRLLLDTTTQEDMSFSVCPASAMI